MNNCFAFYLGPGPSEAKEVGNSKMELGGGEEKGKAENQRVKSAPGSLPSTRSSLGNDSSTTYASRQSIWALRSPNIVMVLLIKYRGA